MSGKASVLVTGSGGVIGRNVVDHFVAQGYSVRGITRREPEEHEGWDHIAADLLDKQSTLEAMGQAKDTTHLVFAAYIEKQNPTELIQVNMDLLHNTLDALEAVGAPLEHVTLYQGMKYYGANLGRFKTPALENDERLISPNFYYEQQELLQRVASERGYHWTIFRPEGVQGYAQGTPMNLLMALAAYVSITSELGVPLRFPGSRTTYDQVFYQVTDAELLAEATEWAGTTKVAYDEAFNLTNGDVFRWSHLFAAIADHYGMKLEEPQEMKLAERMPTYQPLWNQMVGHHGLRHITWEQTVDWNFADMIWNSEWDNVSSTIKVRKAGFQGCHDTITRTLELLDDLIERKIIPPLGKSAPVL
ncbi:SDR family oxidoreductase [Corynebacterium lubricantis]|uniref:SDR family oxidoreductase n=1 Tax=Corynebacterium lubricantis TaxID=541095 RepID=UPI000367A597|nr:SDR family oxidoreductase [Corynebacterium lubricantis]